jgi:GT2 family glycosyltransferase
MGMTPVREVEAARDVTHVVAVVVTYAAPVALRRCLRGLLADESIAEVIVVDNGGATAVEACARVEVIRPVSNDGFGAGANVGFRRAGELGATHVLLVNDDVEPTGGFVAPLLEPFADAGVGAAQPVLVLGDTEPPRVNSLGVDIGPDGAGVDTGRGVRVDPGRADPFAIELFTGGAVMFSATFLADTGGFDERYFLYYEDVDLGRRGSARGWRYVCAPSSVVRHWPGTSTAALGDHRRFLQERNRLWSAFRNEPPRVVLGAVWLSLRRVRHPPRRAHVRALLAGVAGAPASLRSRWRT